MQHLILTLCIFALVGCSSWEKQNQEKAELYLRMGVSHLESGNYPFALRDLLKAEELDPKNPSTQNNLGQVYFMRERYELAEKHLKQALNLDPKYTDARNNLARVLIEAGKYSEAEKELKFVLDDLTYSNINAAYINLGLSKFNQQQYNASLKVFEKVISSQADDCVANTYRGRSYFELKDYQSASEALDRAVGFCQKSLYDEPHYFSALAYYRKGDKLKSAARFEELIKYYPNGKYREKAKGMLDLIRKGH